MVRTLRPKNRRATALSRPATACGPFRSGKPSCGPVHGNAFATFASRTTQLTQVIDGLDKATTTLAGGADDVKTLLTNLASTTQLLATNRQKAIDALGALSRLAHIQDYQLDKYKNEISAQIKQIDAIVGVAATQTAEVGHLVDFLDKFLYALPKIIPVDFAQVYFWAVPCLQDPRSTACPS